MAEMPSAAERIQKNQEALKAAGLEAIAAPQGNQAFTQAIKAMEDPAKVQSRLEFHEQDYNKNTTPEQKAALKETLSILTAIQTLPEGEERDKAFFDFKASYWNLILTPQEVQQFRTHVDEKLSLMEGTDPLEVPYADADGDGAPDNTLDADGGAGIEAYDLDADGTPDSFEFDWDDQNELPPAKFLIESMSALIKDQDETEKEFGKEAYKVKLSKTQEGMRLDFIAPEKPDPEWAEYKTAVETAFAESEFGQATGEERLKDSNELVALFMKKENLENFSTPEAPPALLDEEGMVEDQDGTRRVPHAGDRLDGSRPAHEVFDNAMKEASKAIRDKDYAAAIKHGFEALMNLIPMLSDKFFGRTEASDGVSLSLLKDAAKGDTSQIETLYSASGEQIKELKYKTFDAIRANISNPGDRLAAAAMLGVAQNVDCDNPSQNHCSGWVDTMARKAGFEGRYESGMRAYVNPNDKNYRGWAKGAPNEDSLEAIGGLKPGDMVIYKNGNAFTGYHDLIYVGKINGRDAFANQTSVKGRSGKRSIQFRDIDPRKIAVVSRPGWSGNNLNS